MNKLFILLFICISLHSKAEKDTAFYQYLKGNNLKLESFQLLKSIVENNEQLTVEEWKDFFTLSKTFNDTSSIKKIRYEMLGNDTTNIIRAFLISLHFNIESLSAACLGLIQEKCSIKTYQIFEEFFDVIYRDKVMNLRHPELQNIGHYIEKLESKKAWLAGLLSVFVPGLGTIYMLQTKTGIAQMFNTTILALLPAEMLLKTVGFSLGATIGIVLIVPFYISNIYSAYHIKKTELKKCHKELKNEVLRYCDYQFSSF